MNEVITSLSLGWLAGIHDELGEYQAELDLARLGQKQCPEYGNFFSLEAGALIALGRLADVDDVLVRCQKASLQKGSVGEVMYRASRELAAHGHKDAAITMAKQAAAWYKNRLETGKPSQALRRAYAAALLLAGDCTQALQIRKDLLNGTEDDISDQAAYAVTVVTCGGSHAEARKIADALAKLDRPFLLGKHQYQSARILAVLGDREGAMQALQAAYARGYWWNGTEVHLDFAFDSLRNYLPFQELIKPKG